MKWGVRTNLVLILCLSAAVLLHIWHPAEITLMLYSVSVLGLILYIGFRISALLFETSRSGVTTPLAVCFAIAVLYGNFLIITATEMTTHYNNLLTAPPLTALLIAEGLIVSLVSPVNLSGFDSPSFRPDRSEKGLASILLLTITTFALSWTVASRADPYPQLFGYLFFIFAGLTGTYLLLTNQSKIADSVSLFVVGVLLPLSNTISQGALVGRDIHREFYYANRVLLNNHWDPMVGQTFNSVLPTVALTPTLTTLLPIELSTTLKVAYPVLMGVLVLTVYRLSAVRYGRQSGITAASLFAYIFPFYFGLTTQPRQQITLLFAATYLLYFPSDSMTRRNRLGVIILFGCGVLSHYATSILFVIWIFTGVAALWGYQIVQPLASDYLPRITYSTSRSTRLNQPLIHIFLATVLLYGWYGNIASGVFIDRLIILQAEFINSLIDIIAGTQSSTVTQAATGGSTNVFRTITKVLYFFTMFATGVGALSYAAQLRNRESVEIGHGLAFLFGVSAVGFLAVSIVFPDFDLELSRLLQITFLLIGPFAWFGFKRFCDLPSRLRIDIPTSNVIAVFLLVFLLFGSGAVYEVTDSSPNNAVLSQNSIHSQSPGEQASYYNFYTVQREDAEAGRWYGDYIPEDATLYATGGAYYPFESYGMWGTRVLTYHGNSQYSKQLNQDIKINENAVLYQSYVNTNENLYMLRRSTEPLRLRQFSELKWRYQPHSKVYTTGPTSLYRNSTHNN